MINGGMMTVEDNFLKEILQEVAQELELDLEHHFVISEKLIQEWAKRLTDIIIEKDKEIVLSNMSDPEKLDEFYKFYDDLKIEMNEEFLDDYNRYKPKKGERLYSCKLKENSAGNKTFFGVTEVKYTRVK